MENIEEKKSKKVESCEIPDKKSLSFFTNIKSLNNNSKINMKDYIEVTSAIALAMQGLGYGVKNINFKKPAWTDQLPGWLKMEVGNKKTLEKSTTKKPINFSIDWHAKWDATEKWLLRTATAILSFVIIYSIIATFLKVETDKKIEQAEEVRQDTLKQIQLAETDIQTLNNKAVDYTTTTENLKNYSDEVQTQSEEHT